MNSITNDRLNIVHINNTKKMRTIYLILGIALLALASCSSDTGYLFDLEDHSGYCSNSISNKFYNTSNETLHPLIEGRYVDYVDNQYIITISKRDAEKKGISEKDYDILQIALNDGNRYLAMLMDSCKSLGYKVECSTSLYEKQYCHFVIPRTKTSGESSQFPHGTIQTIGQEHITEGIKSIPPDMASVEFDCYSYAALFPIQVAIAESWNIRHIKSGIGQHVTMTVGFSVTNVPGLVGYGTSDSNGCICSWRGSSQNVFQNE